MAQSSGIAGTWNALGLGARIGLAVGVLVIGVMVVGGAIWSMQPDYRVLFSNLSETDAAAIVTELKRTKTVLSARRRRYDDSRAGGPRL